MQTFFWSLKVDITENLGPDTFLGKKGRIKKCILYILTYENKTIVHFFIPEI